jgi:hypothetical protein
MNKVYFTAPLAALLVFAGIYAWSLNGQKERIAAREVALKAEHAAKIVAEQEARRIAIEETLVIQAQRKKERAERDAREATEREVRAAALEARETAFREQERLSRQVERLQHELATEQEAVGKLRIDRDAALAEHAFLKAFVPQARANAAELQRVLERIAAAEAERVRQAAEASRKKS